MEGADVNVNGAVIVALVEEVEDGLVELLANADLDEVLEIELRTVEVANGVIDLVVDEEPEKVLDELVVEDIRAVLVLLKLEIEVLDTDLEEE